MQYSVIIPVYNCKAALTACVESLLSGLPEDSEIILVDDGSMDGTGDLCDGLQRQDGRIRVIHQENRGAAAARNRGLVEARGQYILFADGDDRVNGENLRKALETASAAGNRLAVFGLTETYFHRQICYREDVFLPPQTRAGQEDMYGWYTAEVLNPLWNKIFRRDVIEAHHLRLREEMIGYEDLEFVLRYLSCCDGFFGIPLPVYDHRQWEGENRAVRRMQRIESLWEILGPVEAALGENEAKEKLLRRLLGILAREKLMGADRAAARRVCREYAAWVAAHGVTEAEQTGLLRCVRLGNIPAIRWRLAMTALRHRLAVAVKTFRVGRKRI